MAKITRRATVDQELEIARCPACNAEVDVGDCGYTTFNPGWAECRQCRRKWSFTCVSDSWDVAKRFNEKATEIRRKLRVLSMLEVKQLSGIGRQFTEEVLAEEAKLLLNEMAETIIDSDKTKATN
jgi:hypothetical protein